MDGGGEEEAKERKESKEREGEGREKIIRKVEAISGSVIIRKEGEEIE